MDPNSSNFRSLVLIDTRLFEVAARAERAVHRDPVATLMHLRSFGELLTRHIAANLGEYKGPKATQRRGAMALSKRGVPERVIRMLEDLRRLGNVAIQKEEGSPEDALAQLRHAFELAVWFQRSVLKQVDLDFGPFVVPNQDGSVPQQVLPESGEPQAQQEAAMQVIEAHVVTRVGPQEVARRRQDGQEIATSLAAVGVGTALAGGIAAGLGGGGVIGFVVHPVAWAVGAGMAALLVPRYLSSLRRAKAMEAGLRAVQQAAQVSPTEAEEFVRSAQEAAALLPK